MKVVKNVISKIRLLYLYKENKFFILRNLVFQVENSFHKLESFLCRGDRKEDIEGNRKEDRRGG